MEFAKRLGMRCAHMHAIFAELERQYATPPRHHHTLRGHIAACLGEFDCTRYLAKNPLAIEAALWFHDAFFIAGSRANEAKSAAWMAARLKDADADKRVIKAARRLIAATTHRGIARSRDAKLVCDIDLSILGKSSRAYLRYARGIRKEYAAVPERQWQKHRATFLQTFLARPFIYATLPFRAAYETQARANIDEEIQRLTNPLLTEGFYTGVAPFNITRLG